MRVDGAPANFAAPPDFLARLIPPADGDLADAEAGQFPDAGAAGVLVGVDVDVDHIGLVGGDGVADGVADVAGAVDPHALDASRAR